MFNRSFQNIALTVLLSFIVLAAAAQKIKEPRTTAEWEKAYQPFRIAGNLYYVGTYDLGCYLITTSQGNILINTGLAASITQIKNNIAELGFKFSDTKIVLTPRHITIMSAPWPPLKSKQVQN